MRSHDEDIPYRSPVTEMLGSQAQQTSVDEVDYDTLRSVHTILKDALAGLYKDFNAFKLLEGVSKGVSGEDLVIQISAKQQAYDIIAPLLDSVEAAIKVVDDKYKER